MGVLLSMPVDGAHARDVERRRPFVPRVVTDEIEEALRARALAKPQLAIHAALAVEATKVFIVVREEGDRWSGSDTRIDSVWDSLEGAKSSVPVNEWSSFSPLEDGDPLLYVCHDGIEWEIYAFEVKRGMRS